MNREPYRPPTWPAPPPEPASSLDWRLLLYNGALLLFAPLLAAYLLWRIAWRGKSRSGWGERMGCAPLVSHDGGPRIWLHAVSAGEVAAAGGLIAPIKRAVPGARIFVSTTTTTGRAIAQQTCREADAVFYYPLDLLPAVERALRHVRPTLCVMIESELWPNFLSATRRRGIPTMVVNGRVSDRTLRRMRLLRPLFGWIVRRVDRFCMQSQRDAERMVSLGAPATRVTATGHVKFDQIAARVSDAEREALRRELGVAGAQTVVIAASTHPGEEKLAIEAFQTVRQVDPAARLIIAPRHIERTPEVEQTIAQAGMRARRRSRGLSAEAEGPSTVIVLDTMGELERVYAVATVAFIGGSFAPVGGHNVLQATAQGVPCVVGPHMHNQLDMTNIVVEAGLGAQVQRPQELGPTLAALIEDRKRLQDIGKRARQVLMRHQGSAARAASAVAEMLGYRAPAMQMTPSAALQSFVVEALSGADRSAAAVAVTVALAPASFLYWLGLKVNRLAYTLGLARVTRLPAQVVSIGNLTTGGTGKTSAAAVIAQAALAQGRRPAILSRGHGRREKHGGPQLVSDGATVASDHAATGDEPFLLARKVQGAMVLVGKDRRETGRRAVEEFGADLLILDDGFQYWRLAKDCEIVLIDALCPFGNGLLLPAGLMREPRSHLRRATAVWITHSDLVDEQRMADIKRCLRRFFAGPIVETIHRPVELYRLAGDERRAPADLNHQAVAALSGIGNPRAFELTLERLGARVTPVRFPDHYPFSVDDGRAIDRFARQREAMIVTTEKDAVRLPPEAFTQPVWVLTVELAPTQADTDLACYIKPQAS